MEINQSFYIIYHHKGKLIELTAFLLLFISHYSFIINKEITKVDQKLIKVVVVVKMLPVLECVLCGTRVTEPIFCIVSATLHARICLKSWKSSKTKNGTFSVFEDFQGRNFTVLTDFFTRNKLLSQL